MKPYSIVIGLIVLLAPLHAWASDSLTFDYTAQTRPAADTVYEITGYNPNPTPQVVIIKITDQDNPAYHNRVNEERWVLSGAFTLWVQPAALQTPADRFLNLAALKALKVFSPAPLEFTGITERPAPDFGPYAFDFGPTLSPLHSGFKAIDPTSPFVSGTNISAFTRKGGDSLIRDGLQGVTKLQIPLPNGPWRVHLWTEDLGAWETLPPLYERRIRLNGQDRSYQRHDHNDWIRTRYLRGKQTQGDTPWQQFGHARGAPQRWETTVTAGQLTLDFAGSNKQATTITGLLIEPLHQDHSKALTTLRRQNFALRWPYITASDPDLAPVPNLIAFAGETVFIPYAGTPLPSDAGFSLTPYRWASDFRRSTPNSGLLVQQKRRLMPLSPNEVPDLYAVTIPQAHPAGIHQMGAQTITVIAAPKPALESSIGVYLEAPPHLKDPMQITQQIWCDLDFLRRLGLNAIAPPFSPHIKADYDRARAFGYQDILAYTPMKRHHQAVRDAIQQGVIEDLFFSIADEPSNPAQMQRVSDLSSFLQNESPFAKRAGHLNHPRDKQYLPYLDLVLINAGYGVDAPHIQQIKAQKKTPWFYNMEDSRLAAGFYLWRVGAAGYLQWHARMPTADPYDPTDGREDDVQMLYPNETVCSQQQAIDYTLMQMVQGLSDLRWLRWLDQQAKTHNKARQLQSEIKRLIPPLWQDALAHPPSYWQDLRNRIQKLALHLQDTS